MPLAPQLQDYLADLRSAQQEVHAVADGLPADAFNWKPAPDAWSVGECVVHLNIVAEGYVPALEGALTDDAPRGAGPFRYGWVSRRFIDALRPGSRPIRTGRAMKPAPAEAARSHHDPAATLADFDRLTDRLATLVERADGLDVGRIRMRSPFLRPLRLPVGAFLEAIGQHALRHAGQARRVTEHPAFPRPAPPGAA